TSGTGRSRMSGIFSLIVPREDRGRFEEEWQANLSYAAELGLSQAEVARAARCAAVRLRMRRLWADLTGRRGYRSAVWGWMLVAVALGLSCVAFGAVLVLILLCQFMLVRALGSRLAAIALATQVVALGTSLWLWNIGFSAADAQQSQPWWVELWLPALVLAGISALCFWVLTIRWIRRCPEPAASGSADLAQTNEQC
ncbi:MAG: hypothetical protein ACRCWS_03835, partial [Propionibacteriaceae bacterium]